MIEVKIGQHRDKRNPQPDGSPKTKKLMNSFETWMKKKYQGTDKNTPP